MADEPLYRPAVEGGSPGEVPENADSDWKDLDWKDPDWKYVNVRRYLASLEQSLDAGTQSVVFEPNGPDLWGRVRSTVEDFLLNEWQAGALKGLSAAEAYTVRCDQTTMTQDDLDNGRLICVIGVAPVKPAEFVVFRISQWTADRKC